VRAAGGVVGGGSLTEIERKGSAVLGLLVKGVFSNALTLSRPLIFLYKKKPLHYNGDFRKEKASQGRVASPFHQGNARIRKPLYRL
jgi:hypothetical protein